MHHRKEFGLDWPLLAIEHAILNQNQTFLVDILDAGKVTEELWSEEAINGWQKEFIESKATSHERNVALLDIIRRSSRKTYYKLANSLRDYQYFISDILEDGGVILAVHVALEDDDLIETEKRIVIEMASMLYRKSTSKEKANRLLDELRLQVIASKRGGSIVIYIRCRIEKDLNRLREVIANKEMERTLERLFNLLLKKTTIKVLRAKIFEQDLQRAIEIFANIPGSPRLKNQESTDKKNVADQQLGAAMSRPRKEYEKEDQLRSPKEIGCFAIVIGTDDGTSITEDVLKINLNRTEEFSSLQQLPSEMVKESAAAVFRNSIFVTGIGNDHDEIWKLDATLSTWSKCASMIQGRRRHSIGFVDQVLYICGGYVDSDEIALDDVEAYVVANDKFAHVGKLLYAVYSAGKCVNYKASLYIFGGCGSNDKLAHKVQVYDTKFNTCTLLSKPMPRSRGLLRAEIFGNTVILFGRYNCFIYNIDTEIWNARDQFRTDVSNFGLSINKGKVFVIGGGYAIRDDSGDRKWICRDDVRCVPVVNIMTDKPIEWRHHATLPKRLLVDAFGKIDNSETG